MPGVTVVMPAYNVEQYIAAAIESVLAQTFCDFELLVVDDGATDGTAAIAESFVRRDSRVRLLQKTNGGLSSARNAALRRSTAPAIAILDSDDLWDPRFLEAQIELLAKRPDVDIVSGNARNLGGSAHARPARPFPDPRPDPGLLEILADEEAIFIMSVFRRRVYEVVGDFDETMRSNEDYDYWIRAAIAGFRFARNDRPLGWYRRRDDSLSASDARMLRGIVRVYAKAAPLLSGNPEAIRIVESQIARFETERFAAEARDAIRAGDFQVARERLNVLRQRRGGATVRVAAILAQWSPGLLARAFRVRSRWQASGL
jgi:glycosyltransferase involved in cell wall biosynthesis